MHELITADLGPDTATWTAEVAGRIVCVTAPQNLKDASSRRVIRRLMGRQGVDCSACRGCPIGRDAA